MHFTCIEYYIDYVVLLEQSSLNRWNTFKLTKQKWNQSVYQIVI